MKYGIKSNITTLLGLFLLMFFPLLIIGVTGAFLIPHFILYIKQTIAFGCLSPVICCLFFLVNNRVWRKLFLFIATLVLPFLAFIKLSFYYLYDVAISASALFVIFETNKTEASDFLLNYFNLSLIVLLVVLFIPLFWVSKHIVFSTKKADMLERIISISLNKALIKVWLASLISISFFIINEKFQEQNILITSINSYQEYIATKKNLRSQLAQRNNKNLNITSCPKEPQTHVVIIGESTSSWHMQLYGYERDTNPELTEIKKELLIFDNVITPHVHTILALEKALTLSNNEMTYQDNNASVVQLANAADYSTFWLSNQKPVGIHESIPTIISNAADHKYYNATDNYSSYIYDGGLLPSLDEVLKNKSNKKILFVHLIGTHGDYKKRYPDTFKYFNNQQTPNASADKKATKIINQYDNAIRYNDHIVRQIIEKVRSNNSNSFVLYFSDHGDDVFDVENLAGHSEYKGTKPMYEIPFILWMSKSYKRSRPGVVDSKKNREQGFSTEHLIHSFSDLSNIEFTGLDLSKSIFNIQFKEHTRYIKEGIDYDNQE